MKVSLILLTGCMAAAMLCGCSSKDMGKTQKVTETAAAETTVSENMPEGEFIKLPEGAEEQLEAVSNTAHSVFPDTDGKKMFGFKGMKKLELAGNSTDCYIFEYYTYSAKTYSKIATLAKSAGDESVFMLDDATGEYRLCSTVQDAPAE